MKTIENQLIEYSQTSSDEYTPAFVRCFEFFSSVVTESLYVLDLLQNQFLFVKSDDLFLCGFPVEDVLRQGSDFYSKIIHPIDFPLWTGMCKAIFQYLENAEEKRNEIDYFYCTFRLQRSCSSPPQLLSQMVSYRMKHVYEEGRLRYLVCSIENSTAKDAGNLRMYNKDGLTYEEYNFTTKYWKQKRKESLTERERVILMLAQQGKSTKEIAEDLCKGHNTIRNQVKPIFSKLKVHSMQEAIETACSHHLIYSKRSTVLNNE